jgi:hypothetical protein
MYGTICLQLLQWKGHLKSNQLKSDIEWSLAGLFVGLVAWTHSQMSVGINASHPSSRTLLGHPA